MPAAQSTRFSTVRKIALIETYLFLSNAFSVSWGCPSLPDCIYCTRCMSHSIPFENCKVETSLLADGNDDGREDTNHTYSDPLGLDKYSVNNALC